MEIKGAICWTRVYQAFSFHSCCQVLQYPAARLPRHCLAQRLSVETRGKGDCWDFVFQINRSCFISWKCILAPWKSRKLLYNLHSHCYAGEDPTATGRSHSSACPQLEHQGNQWFRLPISWLYLCGPLASEDCWDHLTPNTVQNRKP